MSCTPLCCLFPHNLGSITDGDLLLLVGIESLVEWQKNLHVFTVNVAPNAKLRESQSWMPATYTNGGLSSDHWVKVT